MKSKLAYLASLLAVIGVVCFCGFLGQSTTSTRFWQTEQPVPEAVPSEDFSTHLPIIAIDTAGKEIPGANIRPGQNADLYEETVSCAIRVADQKDSRNTRADVADAQALKGSIRVRGNSSRFFSKSSYLLKLGSEAEVDYPLLGMASDHKWILHGPILDRTLVRNYLCYNVAGEIMEYAPQVRYCELFVNEEYRGVYLAVETITVGEGKLELTKGRRALPVTSWVVRMDRQFKSDDLLDTLSLYTYKSQTSGFSLLYPGMENLTPAKRSYAEAEISTIERTLYADDFLSDRTGYSRYVDRKAFAQYFIINEFFENTDAGRFSTFYYKDSRGKVKPAVWDFNNGSDNYQDMALEQTFYCKDAPWIEMMIKDRDFVKEVISQYRKLRKTTLSDEYLCGRIDEAVAYLGDAADRNNQLYEYVYDLTDTGYIYDYLFETERNYSSYEEAVAQLKRRICRRGAWLDRYIDTLQQYCAESRVISG